MTDIIGPCTEPETAEHHGGEVETRPHRGSTRSNPDAAVNGGEK